MNRLVQELNISQDTHSKIRRLTERAITKGLRQGYERDVFISAIAYIASRNNSEPRSITEISDVLNIEGRKLGRCFRRIAREMNVKVYPVEADKYIERFGKKLMVEEETIEKALEIWEKAKDKKATYGKGKRGVAGACLYIASNLRGEKRTQKDVCQATGTTEVTVRTRYKDIAHELGIDVNN